MNYLSLRNWDRYQHYKDRNPPWIKFYNSLLDEYEFSKLGDETKWHVLACTLLASRTENRIPADPKWIAARTGSTSKVSIEDLVSSGMFELFQDDAVTGAEPEQDASNVLDQSRGEKSRERVDKRALELAFAERFWPEVPNKESKAKSLKAFIPLAAEIGVDALVRYAKQWRARADAERGKSYSPNLSLYPTTWLNERRWESYGDAPPATAIRPQAKDAWEAAGLEWNSSQ